MTLEVKEKIEALGKGFEEFKTAHKKEVEELKANGKVSSDTAAQVEKLNDQVTKLSEGLEAAKAAMNRGRQSKSEEDADAEKEFRAKYREEYLGWARKGEDKTFRPSAEIRELAKKSNSVIIDQDGGFFVTPEMSSEIVKKVYDTSEMRALASVMTTGTDSVEMIEDLDLINRGWVGEKSARPNTDTAKLKKIMIPIHEIYAAPLVTQKLLDDAGFNVEAWLNEKFAQAFSLDENTAFVSGNGVEKPKGILSYDEGTGFNQIQRVESATQNSFNGDDVIELQYALKSAYERNGTFALNRQTEKVLRKLKATDGSYLWQPGLNGGAGNTILGRPIVHFEDLFAFDSVTAGNNASKEVIIFGDFRAGYQIVDRMGIRVLRDPYTHKPYVEFYATKRVGGGVKNFEALKVLKIKA